MAKSEVSREIVNYGHGEAKTPKPTTRNMKTIYVQDIEAYQAAQLVAAEQKISMSELIARAIDSYIHPDACPKCKRMSEILMTGSQTVKAKKGGK